MYRVVSYPTKSTTLTLTDVGSLKNFQKWNRTPKGLSNFNNVRVYLFVDTRVTIVYIVLSYPTKSTTLTLTDIGSQKSFKNGTERRKAHQIFGNVRVYLFVDTLVSIVYKVLSNEEYDLHTN